MDTATRRMIVTMLAEGHPTWYIAAMVNKPTRAVESIATASARRPRSTPVTSRIAA